LKRADSSPIKDLRGPILRAVSRSFYLSIRLLPASLRDSIALAYLLARATDTLADTTEIDAKLREESLRKLARAIQGGVSNDEIAALRDSFARLQNDNSERTLIEALPAILRWLNGGKLDGFKPSSLQTLAEKDKADIRTVLEKITYGQLLDVQWFGRAEGVRAVAAAGDLDEYTYLVAGCVGEFWTNVCFRHLSRFAERSIEEMRELGRAYGKGLQLINILRDVGADFRNGRCYLPQEELEAVGISPNDLISSGDRIAPVLEKWRVKAQQGVAAGIDYSCSIKNARVRFATVIPALIGARTLALLRQAGANALQRSIKIPRTEVRAIISSTTLSLASPRVLRKKFQTLLCSGGL
jgi:farnesyl-diphosphate farnesyltransferase